MRVSCCWYSASEMVGPVGAAGCSECGLREGNILSAGSESAGEEDAGEECAELHARGVGSVKVKVVSAGAGVGVTRSMRTSRSKPSLRTR